MRASRGLAFGFFRLSSPFLWRAGQPALQRGAALALGLGVSACTLITDVDREKIPQPPTPVFPEIDAGPQPANPVPDAGAPDASLPPEPTPDAGSDGGLDVPDAGDAGLGADAG